MQKWQESQDKPQNGRIVGVKSPKIVQKLHDSAISPQTLTQAPMGGKKLLPAAR
jgi:hypothetical protein